MNTWYAERPEPVPSRPDAVGWLRVALRAPLLAGLVFGGLLVLLLVRVVEGPLFGPRRPWTPFITQAVCRGALRILGLSCRVTGSPINGGAMVANHSSWLDIFVLNAAARVTFVSKAEVAGWPGIGWLARATGTLFIRRARSEAAGQANAIQERLQAGQLLLLFPEGTSSDGRQILPFKPTLFQPFLSDDMKNGSQVQPVSIVYHAPPDRPADFYGWWGDMDLAPHLLALLAQRRGGSVSVILHAALQPSEATDRKALAAAAEAAVRGGFEAHHLAE